MVSVILDTSQRRRAPDRKMLIHSGEKLGKDTWEARLGAVLKFIATGSQSWVVGEQWEGTELDKQPEGRSTRLQMWTSACSSVASKHTAITAKLGACVYL